jgi:hypothetical protein
VGEPFVGWGWASGNSFLVVRAVAETIVPANQWEDGSYEVWLGACSYEGPIFGNTKPRPDILR